MYMLLIASPVKNIYVRLLLGVVLIPDGILQYFTSNVFRWPVSGFASFGMCSPKTDSCLVASSVGGSLSFLLLLLRPGRQFRLLFLSTSLLSLGYPSPTPPSLFLTGYFNAQVSGFRYPSPAPPRLFLTGYFDAQVSAFRYPSPAPPRLLLTGYLDAQVSGFRCPSPAPPRLFLAGYLDAQVSVFRCPSPAPPRLFLTGYFDAQVPLFRYPRAFFLLPVLVSLIVFFDALLFSHPTFPSRLLGWPARSLCRLAVRLRFLPLRGFYRSAFAGFLGALLFRRPHACCPPVFTHFRAARSLCRLAVRLRFLPLRFRRFFGGSALPPPSCLLPPSLHPLPGGLLFVPPCGTPAIFTAPRFLPLRGFYRSAVFTAPLSPVFWGLCSSAALMLAAPQSSPTSGRLALCAALRYACDFYRSAVFTAPQFLPLRGFYRFAFAGFFGGLCSFAALMLAAPQSSPTSGRTLWCRLVRSVSGGPPFLTLFLYRLIDRSRSVPAHLTGFPFVHFIHIRGPSIVSSFECRDTGTTCTTTSFMGPFGYRKLGNLTYFLYICLLKHEIALYTESTEAVCGKVPPRSPGTRSPGPVRHQPLNWREILPPLLI